MKVALLSKEEMLVHHNRVVTVLNEEGNKHIRAFAGYNNSQTIRSIQAEIFDKDGNSIKRIKKKEFVDVSAVDGGTLYSDSRVLYMSYLPTEYPYTVSFSYEMKTKNTGTLPSWYFIDDFMASTEKCSYEIEYALSALKPNILEKNFEGYAITRKETLNGIQYSVANIPALRDEYLRPSTQNIFPSLVICPVDFYYEGYSGKIYGWKDVGLWMNNNLLRDQDELLPSTKSEINELVKGVEDSLEKARIVYKYVQENTRYISVQVGIGGLKPISAIEVDKVKYGDCKGLSNYTKALLKQVGVESYYVHVEAGKEKIDFEDGVASLAQGNHVILAIPYNDKYYWVDCTSQIHPFGFLGDFTDDRRVLIMKPEGGEITYTDAYLDEENLQTTKGIYSLDEEGDLLGKMEITTKGIQYEEHFGIQNLPDTELVKYYKNYLRKINNLILGKYYLENNQDEVTFKEVIALSASKYASKTDDGKLIFIPNCFNNVQSVPPRYRNRRFPMEIQRGYLDVDEYIISLPKNFDVLSLPKSNSFSEKFGEYSIEFWKEKSQIRVKRRILIKSGTYSKLDYDKYRSFKRKITKLDNSKIILNKKT
ncbi:DUF3857 domain-containing protein [Flagellimonas meridianipacifica]|nr:DUF3857 domain-containing protein [Allomuricauda pacifica]